MKNDGTVAVFPFTRKISLFCHSKDGDTNLEVQLKTRDGLRKIHLSFDSPFNDLGIFKTLVACWNERANIKKVDASYDSGAQEYILEVYTWHVFAVFRLLLSSQMSSLIIQITSWLSDDARPTDFQLQQEIWHGKSVLQLLSTSENCPTFYYKFPEGTTCVVD